MQNNYFNTIHMRLFHFLNYLCVLDLSSDYIFIWIHSNQPTVQSVYICITVRNAFQQIDFNRQHYFERSWLESGLMHRNIPVTSNLFSELRCSCQTFNLRASQAPVPRTEEDAWRVRVQQPCLIRHGEFHHYGFSMLGRATADNVLLEKMPSFIRLQVFPFLSSGRTNNPQVRLDLSSAGL